MRRTVFALVAIGWVSIIAAIELPDAPKGFAWTEVPEIQGAFLIPDGWHFRSEEDKGTLAFFITEDPFTPPEKYRHRAR